MQLTIKATTRVLGQAGKTVEYFGSTQDDGYVYFNDESFYRAITPTSITAGTPVALTGVQVWYTVRNCWVKSNKFTNLEAELFDLTALEQRVTDLENWKTAHVSALNTRIDAIVTIINDLGHQSLGDDPTLGYGNGDVLYNIQSLVNQMVSTMNSQHGTSYQQNTDTIYIGWTDRQLRPPLD